MFKTAVLNYHEVCAAIYGVAKSQTQLSDWTELNWIDVQQAGLTQFPFCASLKFWISWSKSLSTGFVKSIVFPTNNVNHGHSAPKFVSDFHASPSFKNGGLKGEEPMYNEYHRYGTESNNFAIYLKHCKSTILNNTGYKLYKVVFSIKLQTKNFWSFVFAIQLIIITFLPNIDIWTLYLLQCTKCPTSLWLFDTYIMFNCGIFSVAAII